MRTRAGPKMTKSIGALLLFGAVLANWARAPASAFFIDSRQSPGTSEWNYGDQEAWTGHNRDCAGRAQSPIDILHKNVIISQHLRLHFYNYNQQLKFKLSNAHHTIKMDPLGPAYEQLALESASGQNPARHSYNSSQPIHDMITADEYVEFDTAATAGSVGQSQADSSGQSASSSTAAAAAAATISKQQNKERLVSPPDDSNRPSSVIKLPNVKPAVGKARHQAHSSSPAPQLQPNGIEREAPVGPSSSTADEAAGAGATSEPYEGAPTIKLDWLDDGNNEYKLRDIHFHWGERRDNGSEHAIDGRRAAMEMHLVHIKHGLDKPKIGFTSDSVAVIAILIESHRKSNADFNPIVNELARINATHAPQVIDYKSIYDLLPSNLDAFYTYSGSLTTPPCYQVVNWIVMAERLNMNAKQIEMFRNLYAPPQEEPEDLVDETGNKQPADGANKAHEGAQQASSSFKIIMPNVRTIQPLNNRTILASFERHGNRLMVSFSHSNSIHAGAPNTLLWNVFYHIGLFVSIISLARSCHTLS